MKKMLCAAVLLVCALRVAFLRMPHVQEGHRQKGALGVYHVHSDASHDSRLSLQTIASVAQENTWDFVVLTDHHANTYHSFVKNKVLFLQWPEKSTPQGHVVRMDAAMSFLAAAHPVSGKRPFNGDVKTLQGMEIGSVSSVLYNQAGFLGYRWWLKVLALPLNPRWVMSHLSVLEKRSVALWDSIEDPSFAGLCALDAHSWVPFSWGSQPWWLWVDTDKTSSAFHIEQSVRQGRVHCVAGWLGAPQGLVWGVKKTQQGAQEIFLEVKGMDVKDVAHTRLLRDGKEVSRVFGKPSLQVLNPAPGLYRAEVYVKKPLFWGGVEPVLAVVTHKIKVL
jgi:hypothetical protein